MHARARSPRERRLRRIERIVRNARLLRRATARQSARIIDDRTDRLDGRSIHRTISARRDQSRLEAAGITPSASDTPSLKLSGSSSGPMRGRAPAVASATAGETNDFMTHSKQFLYYREPSPTSRTGDKHGHFSSPVCLPRQIRPFGTDDLWCRVRI
jgi:hypothetical protein